MMIQNLFLDRMDNQSMGFLQFKSKQWVLALVWKTIPKNGRGLYRKKAAWSDHVQGLEGYEHHRPHHSEKISLLHVAKWYHWKTTTVGLAYDEGGHSAALCKK